MSHSEHDAANAVDSPALVVGVTRIDQATADKFNALADAVEAATPPLFAPGASYVIRLTDSDRDGKYAWREQLAGPPREWVDGPARGTLEAEDWPAYEINGNGTLPLGTIVIARPTNVGDLRFQHGGCN